MAFCWESLAELKENRYYLERWVNKDTEEICSGHRWPEWRQVDYDTVMSHKTALLEWLADWRGERRLGYPEVQIREHKSGERKKTVSFTALLDLVLTQYYLPLIQLMSYEEGIWQRDWPRLPAPVLRMMASEDWTSMLMGWPGQCTLSGKSELDLRKVYYLLEGLKFADCNTAVIMSPRRFLALTETRGIGTMMSSA